MMDDYEKLMEILDQHLAGAPKTETFGEIMRMLFTPEEVKVALGMIFVPRGVEEIARAAGVSPEDARRHCEAMADKGIVFSRTKNGETGYSLLPTIPGIYEFPLMRDEDTPERRKLVDLWQEYYQEAFGDSFAGSSTPISRILPVEQTVESRPEVLPYEKISEMLKKNEFFALALCACRLSVKACDKPLEVCLIFDRNGRYLVERGFAREITREKAMEIVKQAEEAGLVHTVNNVQDRLVLICNCCPCCCVVLRGLTQLENPNAFANSNWLARVNADECTACGRCEGDRCPVDAIRVMEEAAVVDAERCIGCGLCVTVCDPGAITMVPREKPADTPANAMEMGLRIMTEKGKLERFMKLMGR